MGEYSDNKLKSKNTRQQLFVAQSEEINLKIFFWRNEDIEVRRTKIENWRHQNEEFFLRTSKKEDNNLKSEEFDHFIKSKGQFYLIIEPITK